MYHVECYADEKLVSVMTSCDVTVIHHEMGKGNVINKLDKKKKGIGMVDADPGSSPSKKMIDYQILQNNETITIYKHKKHKKCTLIELKPRLEEWLIEIAKRESIPLAKYKIPDNGKILHGSGRYDKDPSFREFLEAIKNSENEDVKLLAKVLVDSYK